MDNPNWGPCGPWGALAMCAPYSGWPKTPVYAYSPPPEPSVPSFTNSNFQQLPAHSTLVQLLFQVSLYQQQTLQLLTHLLSSPGGASFLLAPFGTAPTASLPTFSLSSPAHSCAPSSSSPLLPWPYPEQPQSPTTSYASIVSAPPRAPKRPSPHSSPRSTSAFQTASAAPVALRTTITHNPVPPTSDQLTTIRPCVNQRRIASATAATTASARISSSSFSSKTASSAPSAPVALPKTTTQNPVPPTFDRQTAIRACVHKRQTASATAAFKAALTSSTPSSDAAPTEDCDGFTPVINQKRDKYRLKKQLNVLFDAEVAASSGSESDCESFHSSSEFPTVPPRRHSPEPSEHVIAAFLPIDSGAATADEPTNGSPLRRCADCRLAFPSSSFSAAQRKKGPASVCTRCALNRQASSHSPSKLPDADLSVASPSPTTVVSESTPNSGSSASSSSSSPPGPSAVLPTPYSLRSGLLGQIRQVLAASRSQSFTSDALHRQFPSHTLTDVNSVLDRLQFRGLAYQDESGGWKAMN